MDRILRCFEYIREELESMTLIVECGTEATNLASVNKHVIFRKFFDCKPSMNFWTSIELTPVAFFLATHPCGAQAHHSLTCRSRRSLISCCVVWS